METNYTINSLNEKIKLLENQQHNEWSAIKDHVDEIKHNLKPLNIIRNTVSEIKQTPGLKKNLAQSAVSIAIGLLARKLIIGKKYSKLKNIFGTIVEVAVTTLVSKPK